MAPAVLRFLKNVVITLPLVVGWLLVRYVLAAIPVLMVVVPVGLLVTWIPVWMHLSPRAADNVALFGVLLLFFFFFVLPFIMVRHKHRNPGPSSPPVRLYDAWNRLFPPPWRGRAR